MRIKITFINKADKNIINKGIDELLNIWNANIFCNDILCIVIYSFQGELSFERLSERIFKNQVESIYIQGI